METIEVINNDTIKKTKNVPVEELVSRVELEDKKKRNLITIQTLQDENKQIDIDLMDFPLKEITEN